MDAIQQLSKLLLAATEGRVSRGAQTGRVSGKGARTSRLETPASDLKSHVASLHAEPSKQREAFVKGFVQQTLHAQFHQVSGMNLELLSARVAEVLLEDERLQGVLDEALAEFLEG